MGHYVDATGTTHGFLRDKEGFTAIDVPGALVTNPLKINDRRQIVGISFDADGVLHGFLSKDGVHDHRGSRRHVDAGFRHRRLRTDRRCDTLLDAAGMGHGFLRDVNGNFTTIDVPNATFTGITAVNDRGEMVGVYDDAEGARHAFLLDDGVVAIIDAPAATGVTVPFGINNDGEIVGGYLDDFTLRGFLLSNGTFTTFAAPGTLVESDPPTSTIAVGLSASMSNPRSFATRARGRGFIQQGRALPTPSQKGRAPLAPSATVLFDINNHGQMVGGLVDAAGARRSFVLDDGVITTFVFPGASRTAAFKIDDSGRIVGFYIDGVGPGHGFVLD